jgi:hypothetical protein
MLCKICGKEKSEDEFYKTDKHHCKECIKKRTRENRLKNLEYYREYDRKRGESKERIERNKKYKERLRLEDPEKYDRIFHGIRKRFREKNSEKIKANGIIDDMIRYGKLERPDVCSICGIACTPQAHHPDYSKPKEVIWVCVKCHANIHKQIRAELRKAKSVKEA